MWILFAVLGIVKADFYDKSSGIVDLTGANFDRLTQKDNQIFLVEFYAPWCGHCKALAPEWIKAAKDLKGIVKVGAVNCDEEKNKPLAAKFGIRGFPTIKVFVGKKSPEDYNGERKAQAIVEYAYSKLPTVKKITEKNVESFLQEGELPHALYFTDKKVTDHRIKAWSLKLKGRLALGEVQSKEHAVVSKFDVQTFPTILVFKAGQSTPEKLEGSVATSGLAFLREHALPGEDEDEDSSGPVQAIHDQSCFKAVCVDEGGLCALAILPFSKERASQVAKEVAVLQRVRDARSDSLFHFGWLDSNAQADFIGQAFGLTVEEYPQLVVVSAKKGRFASYLGAYTDEGVSEFLSGVVRGRIKTAPFLSKELPALKGNTNKCGASKSRQDKPQQPKQEKQEARSSTGGAASLDKVGSIPLNNNNFKELVLKSKGDWIVEFFAPWCGHCKNLAPEWKKAAKNLKGMVHFGEVDATVEASLASKYGVQGYPTIKVFKAGNKNKPEDYPGGRTAHDLETYALNLLTSKHVEKVVGTKYSAWVAKRAELPRVLLITQKPQIPPLVKSLSVELLDEVLFGVAKDTDAELASKFSPSTFPAVYYLYPNQTAETPLFHKYLGELNWVALTRALRELKTSKIPSGPPVQATQAQAQYKTSNDAPAPNDADQPGCGTETAEHDGGGMCTAP